MLAILGGIGAALAWAATTLAAARAMRHVDGRSLLATVMTVGLVVSAPWAAATGLPPHVHPANVAWLVAAGGANIAGLLFVYAALAVGKVGVVAPITSTEGAVATVIAVIAGQHLAGGTAAALIPIVLGVTLAAHTPGGERGVHLRSVIFAALAALAFGLGLYATARNGQSLGIAWAVLPPRVVGVAVIAVPLALSGRWRMTRAALPYAVVGGLCEVLGFASYAVGARHGLAIAAVLASQFAGVAAVVSWLVFRERMTRVQIAGVATIVAGVTALSVLQG
jgi:drug/metabolite transporter (DMT)-like permease